jgi:hypothetical protein
MSCGRPVDEFDIVSLEILRDEITEWNRDNFHHIG